ncbi:MAG: BON domain-containing protein [Gemmatimonadota bacterium]
MSSKRKSLWTAAGLAVGAAAGVWLWRQGRGTEPGAREPGDVVDRILTAFASDSALAGRPLEVRQVSRGVVELDGVAPDAAARERAVAIAHNARGVHTVVNRLALAGEEARLAENRARNAERGPSLQHDGMGVGMGSRRQSPDTDPDRPSDRQARVDRELDVPRVARDAEGMEDTGGTGGTGGTEAKA